MNFKVSVLTINCNGIDVHLVWRMSEIARISMFEYSVAGNNTTPNFTTT